MEGITPQELNERLRGPNPPLVLDTRSDSAFGQADRHIAGDIRISQANREDELSRLPRGRDFVTYCT